MPLLDTDALRSDLLAIGKEAIAAVALTPTEKQNVLKWTEAMGLDFAKAITQTGDEKAATLQRVENYRISLNTMLGVVELRAGAARDAATARFIDLAIGTILKVATAALG